MKKSVQNWQRRHRNPTNFWLHIIGIPACFAAGPLLVIFGRWWVGLAIFISGYALQFIGHLVEGNRSGEEILLRNALRKKP